MVIKINFKKIKNIKKKKGFNQVKLKLVEVRLKIIKIKGLGVNKKLM